MFLSSNVLLIYIRAVAAITGARRQGGKEARRQGGKGARGQGGKVTSQVPTSPQILGKSSKPKPKYTGF